MKFKDLLAQKRHAILERWYHLIFNTYPGEGGRFFRKEKNRFANPVAHNVRQGIEGLYDALLEGIDCDKVCSSLDQVIRIRAIQDFSASQAVGFIFFLKKVIREQLEKDIRENQLSEELLAFESKIDDLALFSFDVYTKCREKIYEIRVNEIQNRASRLMQFLERAGFMWRPEEENDLENGNMNTVT
jgi:hypothetical protein